jgi:hypothetical protein
MWKCCVLPRFTIQAVFWKDEGIKNKYKAAGILAYI